MNDIPLLHWYEMNDREQKVWSASFAPLASDALQAARQADEVVRRLRELNIEKTPPLDAWEIAARAGFHIEKNEFYIWYRITSRINRGNERDFQEPTDEQCQIAYDAFQRGRADFY